MLNRELSRGFGAWNEMVVDRIAFMQSRKGLAMVKASLPTDLHPGRVTAAELPIRCRELSATS